MRILAISIAHDSSICSLNDGIIEFYCKEERLSRIKRDKAPFASLDLYKSLNFGKIDHILYITPTNGDEASAYLYGEYTKKTFGVEMENYSILQHHILHANLAFYNSGFTESLVFVIDRNGSMFFVNGVPAAREAESIYIFSKLGISKTIQKNFWIISGQESNKSSIKKYIENYYGSDIIINANSINGIVKVYEAATVQIGQSVLENGKTMGLSSYGDNKYYEPLFISHIPNDLYFSVINNNIPFYRETCFFEEEDKITNEVTKENYQYYANKAKHVQTETQNEVLSLIKEQIKKTGIKNICIVGGYGLNVVANQYYIKSLPDINFYFEPVADDSGISIGATIMKYIELDTKNTFESMNDNFYHYFNNKEELDIGIDSSIDEICQMLINKKSIAIFEGNPEAGPRALGHRSILFDARNIDCKDLINKVKNREWYRPFAGVILENEFKNYFDTMGLSKSEYMTINFDCKENTKNLVPGIVHIDNTSRMQTVSDGFIFDLLNRFYDLTGCPILLNTSFNLAGEPLVQTKDDALLVLEKSCLDAVYFVDENKLVLNNEYIKGDIIND